MKSKTFIIILAVFTLLLSISAPAIKLCEAIGLVEVPKMGNIIEPESEDVIGYIKADIADIYINYLPWYAEIVTGLQTAKVNLNQPFNDFLSSLIVAQENPVVVLESGTKAVDEPEKDAETADEASLEIDEPEVSERYIKSFKSRFLKSSGEGVTFYAVDAVYSDGEKVGLITTAFNTPVKTYAERMRKTADQINAIAAARPDVNAYVYVCSRLQDSEGFGDIIQGEPSLAPLVNDFLDRLDDSIKFDRLKIDSLEDSINLLFKTDHHWNADGMYTAYSDIVKMMYGDDADSILRQKGTRYDIEDADFFGTFARTSGYYDYHDDFYFYDYELPEHTLVADNPYSFSEVMKKYLNGRFSTDISADHYVNFYPYSRYLEYPSNSTGRVVLVLGDSYSRGISELLSSAFDEAYIFDYRRIKEIGDYDKFIDEKGITDVLFMQYSLRGVFDNQNDNTLDRIKLNP